MSGWIEDAVRRSAVGYLAALTSKLEDLTTNQQLLRDMVLQRVHYADAHAMEQQLRVDLQSYHDVIVDLQERLGEHEGEMGALTDVCHGLESETAKFRLDRMDFVDWQTKAQVSNDVDTTIRVTDDHMDEIQIDWAGGNPCPVYPDGGETDEDSDEGMPPLEDSSDNESSAPKVPRNKDMSKNTSGKKKKMGCIMDASVGRGAHMATRGRVHNCLELSRKKKPRS